MSTGYPNKNTEKDYQYGADYWEGRIYKRSRAPIELDNLEEFASKIVECFNNDRANIEHATGLKFDTTTDKVVAWKTELQYFKFVDLKKNNEDTKRSKIRVDINPCIGSQRHTTKVFVIPLINLESENAETCETRRKTFFAESEKTARQVMDVITNKYFGYIDEKIRDYHSIFGHVLSVCPQYAEEDAETLVLKNAINAIMVSRPIEREIVHKFLSPILKLGSFATRPNIDQYRIFGQSYQDKGSAKPSEGLYGYCRNEDKSYIVGFTTCYPHQITREIMIDIINGT